MSVLLGQKVLIGQTNWGQELIILRFNNVEITDDREVLANSEASTCLDEVQGK